MDTSEEYIKMCDCEEIQKLWKEHHWGDFVAYSDESCAPHALTSVKNSYHFRDYYIWLPRQDQLQDIAINSARYRVNINPRWLLHIDYENFCYGKFSINKSIDKFKSFEQLWLAFVMKEKYNKEWNGEKWI